eukprot:1154045-Pelagomonas_calceolata.AAC.11
MVPIRCHQMGECIIVLIGPSIRVQGRPREKCCSKTEQLPHHRRNGCKDSMQLLRVSECQSQNSSADLRVLDLVYTYIQLSPVRVMLPCRPHMPAGPCGDIPPKSPHTPLMKGRWGRPPLGSPHIPRMKELLVNQIPVPPGCRLPANKVSLAPVLRCTTSMTDTA